MAGSQQENIERIRKSRQKFRRDSWKCLQPPTWQPHSLRSTVIKPLTITKTVRQLTIWPSLITCDNWQYNNFLKVYEQVDFLLRFTCFLDRWEFYNSKMQLGSFQSPPDRIYSFSPLQYHEQHWNNEAQRVIKDALHASSMNQYKNYKSSSGFPSICMRYL